MQPTLGQSGKLSKREWIILLAILLIAFAFRTIDLTRVPPGLHNDEVVAAKITETVVNGRLAIKAPWPGQLRTTYGSHDRFEQVYTTGREQAGIYRIRLKN